MSHTSGSRKEDEEVHHTQDDDDDIAHWQKSSLEVVLESRPSRLVARVEGVKLFNSFNLPCGHIYGDFLSFDITSRAQPYNIFKTREMRPIF